MELNKEKLEILKQSINKIESTFIADSFLINLIRVNEDVEIWIIKSINAKFIATSTSYIYNDDDDNILFCSLRVEEKYRNSKIATKMINFHLELAKLLNRNSYLTASEGSWMQGWYERLGYKEVTDADYEAKEGYIWMSKNI